MSDMKEIGGSFGLTKKLEEKFEFVRSDHSLSIKLDLEKHPDLDVKVMMEEIDGICQEAVVNSILTYIEKFESE